MSQLDDLLGHLRLPTIDLLYLDETWRDKILQIMNETAGAPGGNGISSAKARHTVLSAECCCVESALWRARAARAKR